MSGKSNGRQLPPIGRIFVVLTVVVSALHYYIGLRLLPWLGLNTAEYYIGIFFLLFSVIAIPTAMLARFLIQNEKISDVLSWIGLSAMGLFSSLFVLTFLRDVILLAGNFFLTANSFLLFQFQSAWVVLILAVLATIIGFINARRLPAITHVDIPLKNLPKGLQNFIIVQISDIHIGPTIKGRYLERIIEKVNTLKPQVVAITGDLVDGSVAQLSQQVAPLKNIRAEYGSYFVTGNHEYYSGASEWIKYIDKLGVRVLLNDHEIITHNNAQLIIAGVTDYAAGQINPSHRSDPQAALAGCERLAIPKIMLAHQPRSAEAVAAAGANLQLSGHTHGGQFWPWNFFVPLQQPYTVGLHKLNNLWIYINRGTGYWGPPKRLGGRSEITCIRLVNETSADEK